MVICAHICKFMFSFMHLYTGLCSTVHTHTHIYIYICMYVCTCMYIYIYIYIYILYMYMDFPEWAAEGCLFRGWGFEG